MELIKQEIKICSLNSHGIKGNLAYVEKLSSENDIVFISEHWLYNNEQIFFDSITKNRKVFFYSAMDDTHRIGRPFGGLCWLINNNFEIISYEFISSHLSVIKIKIGNRILAIIGVYCIYNNNTSEHIIIYENQLAIISGICEQLNDENLDYVLLGDFNADPYRNKYVFDKRLNEFITNNNLINCLSIKTHQFTYSNAISNSCIDHIFMNHSLNIVNKSCQIEYNINNTSDHNAMKLNLEVIGTILTSYNNKDSTQCNINTLRRNKKIINWSSSKSNELYRFFVEDKLSKIKFNSIFKIDEIENFKSNIDLLYNTINSALIDSIEDVNYILNGNKVKDIHKQSWWTNELFHLKRKIKESRYLYSNDQSEDNRLNYKIHKKNFRRIQRRNIFMYETNKSKNIEHLYEINNKDSFWKAFNSYKNGDKSISYSDSQVNDLFTHFKKLFHSTNEEVTDDNHKQNINQRVKSYYNECKTSYHNKDKIYVNNRLIEECIEEMNASNSHGWDGVCSNMVKNGNSYSLIRLLKSLFNSIICSGFIPTDFNRVIINPIIKDNKKKAFEINNYRPVSISNCFSQIFERIILKLLPQIY
jgi:hypothetical protein